MFKINKLESILCNDCGHTTNNGGIFIDWYLHLKIQAMFQLMDPRGEYLENYRCVDAYQKFNTSTKAVYVTQLYNALVIQLNIMNESLFPT